MTAPLLTIGLLHGSLDGRIAKVRISQGAKTLGVAYVTAMRALTGTAVECELTYEDAEKAFKRMPDR